MTREAKIGMLTGLGVIVLIGVLLSEYLGGAAGAHGMSPTGRMANLPMGAAYRNEITQPRGVPGLAHTEGATGDVGSETVSGGSMPAAPLAMAATDQTGAPRMDTPINNGPAMNQPVAPVPAGRIQMDQPVQASIPTMQLPANSVSQAVYVPGQPGQTDQQVAGAAPVTPSKVTFDAPATGPKVAGQEYVIGAGDTLMKISKKFYKSSKPGDVQRIVAANPTVLKNDKTMLVAGKKLIIPTVAPEAVPTPAADPVVAAASKKVDTIIRKPGVSVAAAAPAKDGPKPLALAKKESPKVYAVQENDTLEKIAKKIAPGNVKETVKKIMAANGIKDVKSLQVGMKLKLPAA